MRLFSKIKALLAAGALLFSAASLGAQGVDSLYISARGALHQELIDGHYYSSVSPDYLYLNMFGKVSENISFRFRQKLNNRFSPDDPFNATDWLLLKWRASEKLSLYTGKMPILVGGYEYDSVPIDVYFYSLFCNTLAQGYTFSIGGEYSFRQGQILAFQLSNSPIVPGYDRYAYNFGWIGHLAPWWETIWTLNLMQDWDKNIHDLIALGNHMVFGNLAVDVDLYHRTLSNPFKDYSAITKIIWRVGKWNLCAKGGTEIGESLYPALPIGQRYWYGGLGVEYFPLDSEKVRFHLAYFTDNLQEHHNIELGVKWRMDIIR